MKNRKREWNQLQKYSYEIGLESYKLVLMDSVRAIAISPKTDRSLLRIKKCFPIEKEIWTFEEFKRTLDKTLNEYCLEECHFNKEFVDIACNFYKNHDKLEFYIPKKANPLIISTKASNFCFAIAPKVDEAQIDSMQYSSGFMEVTGCSCPKFIEEKVRERVLLK